MMLSASIEIIWQLAGREAITADFREIEPEHFLLGLLKFAELPVDELAQIIGGSAAEVILHEVRAIRELCAERQIETTPIRRALRTHLGRGSFPYSGGQIHRSDASRALFDRASQLAAETGSEVTMASHMLAVLLNEPTPAMLEVVGNHPVHSSLRVAPPLPTGQAPASRLPEVRTEGSACCRAIWNALAQGPGSVLLVAGNEEETTAIAGTLGAQSAACGGKQSARMLVDVSVPPATDSAVQVVHHYRRLFNEAAEKNTILYVPAIDDTGAALPPDLWLPVLKDVLQQKRLRCLCRVSPSAYQRYIVSDPVWKSLVQCIWLHPELPQEIPWEL